MRRLFFGVCVLLLAGLPVRPQSPPGEEEIQSLIASMREAALAFDSRLPDFICSQVTRREIGVDSSQVAVLSSAHSRGSTPLVQSTASGWKALDTFEQELTYFGHKESYKLIRLNGKAAKPGQEPPPGAGSSGEFGTTLRGIFDPESHARFTWKRAEQLRGHPAYVFSFAIAKENSTAMLAAGTTRLVVPYEGLIFVDRESKTVLRVTTDAETPPDFPLQRVTHLLDYGRITIAGEAYMVPIHGEMQMSARKDYIEKGQLAGTSPLLPFRNTIDFRSYRKYGADAVIKPE